MFNEDSIRTSKQQYANADFNLLISQGVVAFYKGCEVTQIFIFDREKQTAINFYTLFTFDEIDSVNEKPIFWGDCLQLNKRYSCGIQKKRITLEKATACFKEIQMGILHYDEDCQIAKDFYLLPKTFVPQVMQETVFLNYILKPNYWGDSYVIEFFDEQKTVLTDILSDGKITNKIYEYINGNTKVKLDLSKVYDRIGNVIFQFPITLYKTNVLLEENGNDVRFTLRNHPSLAIGKHLHITLSAHFDNAITGLDSFDTDALEVEHIFCLGDNHNLTTTIQDMNTKLILHKSEINFMKDIQFSMNLGEEYSKPRTLNTESGYKEIELVHRDVFNARGKGKHTYSTRIHQRILNTEIINQSKKLGVFKQNQQNEALQFIRQKIKEMPSDFNALCLWDPYLMPADIVNTLYFENSGMEFRCLTDYQKTKGLLGAACFSEYKTKVKEEFERLSNNHRVHLKLLARHNGHGWEFHDRFLIFVPRDAFSLPIVYSLGISVNQLGKHHHIIQQVPNPRIILKNFEELWQELDNEVCRVIQFPEQ